MPLVSPSEKIAPWIQTLKGRAFDFENMASNVWDAEEVATVLSRLPRFVGHSKWFYSVAQHSVLVARRFEDAHSRYGLAALLHDATEAFIGDVTAPLKAFLNSRQEFGLALLESRISVWVAVTHKFHPSLFTEIRYEDLAALATEARDLMVVPPRPWIQLPEPWPARIEPWSQEYARDAWLEKYWELAQ